MKNSSWHRTSLFLFSVIVIVCSSILCGYAGENTPQNKKKILLIHSYHKESLWVSDITKGIKEAIRGKNIDMEIFYMDTRRKTSEEWKIKAGKLARAKIAMWQPDVVIAVDDNAQIFVTQQYINKKPYFVFCGVNGDPSDYGLPASNVTGIIERPHFKESINYLKKIVEKVKKIAIISDKGPSSLGALIFMRKEKIKPKVLGCHLIDDFSLWKRRVMEYNRKADALCIYGYHTIKKKYSSESMDPKEVMEWTRKNCTIPTIGFFDFSLKDGMLCGVVESGKEHGYKAATMALDILDGKSIESIPVRTADKKITMLNLKTAQKLRIHIPLEIINAVEEMVR